MGLEAATYITQLQEAWPLGGDLRREGDDHFRLLKRVLKNTFPDMDGPILATPQMLNELPELGFAAFLVELLKHVVPTGAIIKWGGSIASIPEGYALCNGQTVTGYGVVPDLRNRFVVGAGDTYAVAATGGGTSYNTGESGAHTHDVTTGETTLTVNQIPILNFRTKGSFSSGGYDGGSNVFFRMVPGDPFNDTDVIENIGGGAAHSHPGGSTSEAAVHTHGITNVIPPYYALAYIIKTSSFVMPE
jgi:hypothetical protein